MEQFSLRPEDCLNGPGEFTEVVGAEPAKKPPGCSKFSFNAKAWCGMAATKGKERGIYSASPLDPG
jgi:hypothetical protein